MDKCCGSRHPCAPSSLLADSRSSEAAPSPDLVEQIMDPAQLLHRLKRSAGVRRRLS